MVSTNELYLMAGARNRRRVPEWYGKSLVFGIQFIADQAIQLELSLKNLEIAGGQEINSRFVDLQGITTLLSENGINFPLEEK